MTTNINEHHVHHIAKKYHGLRAKFDGLTAKFSDATERTVRTLEVGAGAWAGGVLDGRTDKGGGALTILHVPASLGVGVGLAIAGHMGLAGKEWSGHLNNLGDGFIANFAAGKGHAFGQHWLQRGTLLPFGGTPNALPAAAVHGEFAPSQAQVAQMAGLVAQQMGR